MQAIILFHACKGKSAHVALLTRVQPSSEIRIILHVFFVGALREADPLSIVKSIRLDRCALVQHPKQFEFVHAAAVRYCELEVSNRVATNSIHGTSPNEFKMILCV